MATPDTSVKFIHSGMIGHPTLTGQAGTLLAVLDACLVNGFGTGTVDSVVIASGVGTVTRSAGHPAEVGTVMLLSGATVSGGSIDGEQKVLATTATTWTFDATGISNQTATGTVTAKVAPLGWSNSTVAAGTNVKAYKSSDLTATACLLRVDDTGTTLARVIGYESMTGINNGSGPFPTASQISGGAFWMKSSAANSTERHWVLFGDGKKFYLAIQFQNGSLAYSLHAAFGDDKNVKSGDAYCCSLTASPTDQSAQAAGALVCELDQADAISAANVATYMPRSSVGAGAAVAMRKTFPSYVGAVNGVRSGASATFIPFPNPADGGLYVVPHYLVENNTLALRAQSAGFFCAPQNITSGVFASKDSIVGVTNLTGRVLRAINSSSGVFFFDTTGPWR